MNLSDFGREAADEYHAERRRRADRHVAREVLDYEPLSEPADFSEQFEAAREGDLSSGGARSNAAAGEHNAPPTPIIIKPTPFVWRDPTTIPPRQWLYGGHMIRRFVSATIAPGGVGKSSLLLAEMLAMASGLPLLGKPVKGPLRVWYWCGEDPREEIERRIAALMLHYGVTSDAIQGRLFFDGRELEIIVAEGARSGVKVALPTFEAVKGEIQKNHIDVMGVDPFVSSHRVGENDNMAIDAVAKVWRRVADEANCAVDLVHHVRKTGGAEITVEDGRGASSLIAAARSARVLNPMSAEEAAQASVENRRGYFRCDNGKANLAPPSEKSDWFKIVSQPLDNGQGEGPGDFVGVVTPWEWPNAFDGVTVHDLRKAQEAFPRDGLRKDMQSKDWAGHAIGAVLGIETQDKERDKSGRLRVSLILKTWIKNGSFRVEFRRDAKHSRDVEWIIVGERA